MFGTSRLVAFLTVLGLLLASCVPTSAPTAQPAQPVGKPAAAPEGKAAAPAATPKPAAAEPKFGGMLTTDNQSDPPHFDLHQLTGASQRRPLRPAFHELVEWDPYPPNSAVVGGLAESWQSSSDGLTWTFLLRKGVKFHDGSPMTSEDVKFTLDRMREPPRGVASARASSLAAVKDVDVVDQSTVRVTLKYPQAAFLGVLTAAEPSIYSASAAKAGRDPRRDVIGTGPFKLKRYNPGVSVELEKNKDYYVAGRPYLDGITFYLIRDIASRFAAFRTGQVKVTSVGSGGLTPPQADLVKREMKGQAEAIRYPGTSSRSLQINIAQAPWSDVRVRRAVHLATDRQVGVKVVDEGAATIGGYLLPSSDWSTPQEELLKMPGYRQPKDADRAEARKLLEEAGFPKGFEVTLTVGTQPFLEKMAEYFVAQLDTIGIKVRPTVIEYSLYLDALRTHKYVIGVLSQAAYFHDPDEVLGGTYVGGAPRNYTNFKDSTFDELYAKQSRTVDGVERKKIVSQIERLLFDQVPAVALWWIDHDLGIWNQVKNYHPGWGWLVGVRFTDVWLAR
ncbi:MAG: ABC transporter substrate-binding protein [Chloroflexi bacterium]|nr:ABC transporter substrate-binding protein [Chloroflexota bacterium]